MSAWLVLGFDGKLPISMLKHTQDTNISNIIYVQQFGKSYSHEKWSCPRRKGMPYSCVVPLLWNGATEVLIPFVRLPWLPSKLFFSYPNSFHFLLPNTYSS